MFVQDKTLVSGAWRELLLVPTLLQEISSFSHTHHHVVRVEALLIGRGRVSVSAVISLFD